MCEKQNECWLNVPMYLFIYFTNIYINLYLYIHILFVVCMLLWVEDYVWQSVWMYICVSIYKWTGCFLHMTPLMLDAAMKSEKTKNPPVWMFSSITQYNYTCLKHLFCLIVSWFLRYTLCIVHRDSACESDLALFNQPCYSTCLPLIFGNNLLYFVLGREGKCQSFSCPTRSIFLKTIDNFFGQHTLMWFFPHFKMIA